MNPEFESNIDCYSDMYKSIWGIRPRWMYEQARAWTLAEWARAFEDLRQDAAKNVD